MFITNINLGVKDLQNVGMSLTEEAEKIDGGIIPGISGKYYFTPRGAGDDSFIIMLPGTKFWASEDVVVDDMRFVEGYPFLPGEKYRSTIFIFPTTEDSLEVIQGETRIKFSSLKNFDIWAAERQPAAKEFLATIIEEKGGNLVLTEPPVIAPTKQ